MAARVWQFRRPEPHALELGRRWLSEGCFALGRAAPGSRPRAKPCAKASKPAVKNTMLKGYGNPVVMRRLIDSEDDADDDDDFLVDKGGAEDTEAGQQQVNRKRVPAQPTHVRVQTAEYISSSTKLESCPQDGLPEFAIIGRSNVGKSSLINMLTKCKNLALTSKQPGMCLSSRSCARNLPSLSS